MVSPTAIPSVIPSPSPTKLPTTSLPTLQPSLMPSPAASKLPTTSTPEPTEHPTYAPTNYPTTYPTLMCECILISTDGDEISELFMKIEERNGRFQWEDGNTGWTLFWVEDGIFGQTWIIQGDGHETYWAIDGVPGNGIPPRNGEWQKFTTSGYNLAADEYLNITTECKICVDTLTPTPEPTDIPTRSPTSSPTCQEDFIKLIGCCGEDFEGIYERQEDMKNGKYHYFSRNGYSVYYVHDGMFANHWVCQSPDNDYFYLLEFSEFGDEPVIDITDVWKVYRGASFSYTSEVNITISCTYTLEPTRSPTLLPSKMPTKSPTRSPSSSPTIFPTETPSQQPSVIPTPSPNPAPSVVPTPSPSKLPTTSQPSERPSLMPSPSPTKLPTTLEPTPLTMEPTVGPTMSPTKFPTSWCSGIMVNGGTAYDGLYEQTGFFYNQHYEWKNEHQKRLFWHDADYYPSSVSWAIEGEGKSLIFEEINPNWLNTPPLTTETWYEYVGGSSSGGDEVSLTLLCTTCQPTNSPTSLPTPRPSMMPSPTPSKMPTTFEPTLSPSLMPSPSPTKLPTTPVPSTIPSIVPSPAPSSSPSPLPTPSPTKLPTTSIPTAQPSSMPTPSPSSNPSSLPTPSPTSSPITATPSSSPSLMPSPSPSSIPSVIPTPLPTSIPSTAPTPAPTVLPTTSEPSLSPSLMPSPSPTELPTTKIPSASPSLMPSPSPSQNPSDIPTPSPMLPTLNPTLGPTAFPTGWCPCIKVNTTWEGLSGTYMASGYVINQHYQWETHDGNQIAWSYTSEKWAIISVNGNVAIFNEDDERWQNTPPIGQEVWDAYEINSLTPVPTKIELYCDTCAPTPLPTPSPTMSPTTPNPTLSPSLMPSPSPTSIPSAMPTGLPSTPIPTSS